MKLKDLEERDKAGREGDAQARRALNALAMTSNIVSALIQNPGPQSDHQSMVMAARSMLKSADETTSMLVDELALGSVAWARFRVMRMASGAVADHWAATSRSTGRPSADVSGYLPIWKELSTHKLPEFQFDEPAEDDRVALQVAILDAIAPVMREIAVFDLFHDHRAAAVHAYEQIVKAVDPAMKELCAPATGDRSRKLLHQALLRNAGSVYASAWRKHAEDTVEQLSKLSPDQQVARVRVHPEGFPLDAVDEGFQSSFVKLAELAGYLAQPLPSVQPQDQNDFESNEKPKSTEYEAPDWQDAGPSEPDDPMYVFAGNATSVEADPRLAEQDNRVR